MRLWHAGRTDIGGGVGFLDGFGSGFQTLFLGALHRGQQGSRSNHFPSPPSLHPGRLAFVCFADLDSV